MLLEITNLPQATYFEILYRYFLFYLKSPFLEWQLLFKATFIPTHIAIKYKLKLFFFFYFRCGGQGDILSGALAVFLFWASRNPDCPEPGPGVIAGWAAARLSRACAAQAFSRHGRATTTTDLIAQIESAFSRLYESETCL